MFSVISPKQKKNCIIIEAWEKNTIGLLWLQKNKYITWHRTQTMVLWSVVWVIFFPELVIVTFCCFSEGC